jgi:hypothetical protein
MAEKLLDMVWQLTMPADAPPELLKADAMTEVLKQYEDEQVWLIVPGCALVSACYRLHRKLFPLIS